MHGVIKFDPKNRHQFKPLSSALSYTHNTLLIFEKEAEIGKKIVAIHAEMGCGMSLNYFQKKVPSHYFYVGIGEQHVTFTAGLATKGLKLLCCYLIIIPATLI